MQSSSPRSKFDAIREQYDEIFVIVSPPRCSSTAFARVFWEQPSIRYYAHEPFEGTYFMGQDLNYVIDNLRNPLDLRDIKSYSFADLGRSLVIKEMPYQVGVFPHVETGWQLISDQIKYCKENTVPYMIVDAKDFRNQPEVIFKQIFERLGLPFRDDMLSWNSRPDVDIDNLEGDHHHLYQEVLSSTGMLPDKDAIPAINSFPTEQGYRDHVKHCLQIYQRLQVSPARIRVPVGQPIQFSQDRFYPGG